jgi:phosphopantetheinyl transferase (holo-ACP synthase)
MAGRVGAVAATKAADLAAGSSEPGSLGGAALGAEHASTPATAVHAAARDDGSGASAIGFTADGEARREAFPSVATSVQRVRAPSMAPHAPEGVALSLSHSGGYAAAAASRAAVRVGVDLECERQRDMTRIARFAFTEHEYAQLDALASADERVQRFYILWTLKEAFAKALSLPLLGSLRRCTFLEDGGAWRGDVPSESAWIARAFRASPTVVLSVVALLPEQVAPENFSVSTHEWPAPSATPWRALATLHSGA